jgi:hypothetical protein
MYRSPVHGSTLPQTKEFVFGRSTGNNSANQLTALFLLLFWFMERNRITVSIAAIIGGFSISSIVLVALFAPQSMDIVPWIVGLLSLFGVALGYFGTRRT